MRLAAVVVCYHPDPELIANLVLALENSLVYAVLVDNTDTEEINEILKQDLRLKGLYEYFWMGGNSGIAAAQNTGVRYCVKHQFDAVFFFDQDSIISNGMLHALARCLTKGLPGVVGPVCLDKSSGVEMPAYRLNRFGLPVKVFAGDRLSPYNVDLIISSGSLVTVPTFEVAGLMDENLFIDFVDFEWSARCMARHVPVKVAPEARMLHQIGQKVVSVGGLNSALHSPQRTYFKVRNPLLLLRKKDVPALYALREILASWVAVAIVMASDTQGSAHFKMFSWGVIHGILNKQGAFSNLSLGKRD